MATTTTTSDGDGSPQLLTLHSLLSKAAESHASSPAILVTAGGPTVTFAELKAAVDDVAFQLDAAGIKPGDVISLAFPNTLEFVISFLGVTRARAVAAPLNAAYTAEEFKFYFEDAESKLLILPQAGASSAAEKAAAAIGLKIVKAAPYKAGSGVKFDPPPPTPPSSLPSPLPSDVALFLHTSGTTSRPKGVPLSHQNLSSSVRNIIATYSLSPSDRSYLVMPLFHVHGLMAALLAQLFAAGSVVLPTAAKFSASVFWDEVKEFGATWFTAVPTMHQILLAKHKGRVEAGEAVSYPPLRFIRSCSASLAKAVLEEMESTFNAPVLEAYAMTEASHQMTANPLPANGPHKPNSVGKPTGIELAILDESGAVLPPGERGEVCIRGPNVTAGYKNNPSANEAAFAFGWFHTGDQGLLDADGYLFLTGRLKELINRGGEKISPLEVDAAMLAMPAVAEAVSFAAPDAHYGEEVNAAVVLHEGHSLTESEIKVQLATQLASFKIPKRVFFVKQLPRTATGKIQRRFVAAEMLAEKKETKKEEEVAVVAAEEIKSTASAALLLLLDGNDLIGRSLARLGVRHMYGVVGIPVTAVATSAQVHGIRYLGFRNEQPAGYAASANGFLTGIPGVLLTVSGPGCVHGLAGLSNGMINTWPILMLSGSCTSADVGRGDFQELDQIEAVKPFVKYAGKAASISDIPSVINAAFLASVSNRPGASYVDIPAEVFHQTVTSAEAEKLLEPLQPYVPSWKLPLPVGAAAPAGLSAEKTKIEAAVQLLKSAQRPLVVVGKGAAFARAENELREFVEATKIPFLPTPLGKGLLPDSHPLSTTAARSLAIGHADVALVVGARLNWILHFGEAPKWAPGVKFVLVDVDEEELEKRKPAVGLLGDARVVVGQLNKAIKSSEELMFSLSEDNEWRTKLKAKVDANVAKLAPILDRNDVQPLNFHTPLRIIRDLISSVGSPSPILINEGANTMDLGRQIIDQSEPRTRLDAGTWGTMGVGLGYAIAAAVTNPNRVVIALEGDSAFGFSGMEVETIIRYNLHVVVIIFNNGGVYGGDRRGPVQLPEEIALDPPPTAFVPSARYDVMMEAFGGKGYLVSTAAELEVALKEAIASKKPSLLNVIIDPYAGVESGRMTHKN